MKVTLKVFGAVFVLGLVILIVCHLVLQFGLTKAMSVVLPRIQQETGIEARVGQLSINIPAGKLFLEDVEVRNPEGFMLENFASIERFEVVFDILSLFKHDPLVVKRIEVESALVNVIRNKEGELNVDHIRKLFPESKASSEKKKPGLEKEQMPIPEVLLELLQCDATVRYLDFKLNELDFALALDVKGQGISTLRDDTASWGSVGVVGSLGNNKNGFVTELNLKLAPLIDPETPSFDLTGRVMEIDTRMIASAYNRMGVRSKPFGIEPDIHCRNGRFENSALEIILKVIELEDKLAEKLGGMASIGKLRFSVPVTGSLREPKVELFSGLQGALKGNAGNVLGSFLKSRGDRKSNEDTPPADAVVEILGEQVEEIGKSETAKRILKDLVDGEPSATNSSAPVSTDTVVDILAEQVEEIGESEELKEGLKGLGKLLFGK
ncbi:MAG TPA: hypothetical protein VIR63_03475 [Pontiella sp.]